MVPFIIIAVVLIVVAIVVIVMGRKKGAQKTDEFGDIADEMRYQKPTPIEDAVDVLDTMLINSPSYRHYCELNGTSGTDEPLVGPYSNKQVAYYEVKCYQVVRTQGGTEEKLLAHEKSFAPFFLKDGSCDTKVYVDMESFGTSTLLINSCNRMEGPNSEFAKTAMGLTSSSTKPFSYNMVCDNPELARPDFGKVSGHKGPKGTSVLSRIGGAVVGGLFDLLGSLQGVLDPGRVAGHRFEMAYAGASASGGSYGFDGRSGYKYAAGPGFGGPGMGGRPGMGGFGGRPGGMGGMGGFGRPQQSGFGGLGGGNDLGDMIGGMVIGGMLASLLSQSTEADHINPDTFMGYRIVENIIPVNSAVFTIGEIYRAGDRVYVGKATGENAKSSYFSARPEEEVIAAFKKRRSTTAASTGAGAGLIIVALLCLFLPMLMGMALF